MPYLFSNCIHQHCPHCCGTPPAKAVLVTVGDDLAGTTFLTWRLSNPRVGRSQAGKTALHWAAQFGEAQLLHELMRTADDVNPRDDAGNTPLHLAALNGHLCASCPARLSA